MVTIDESTHRIFKSFEDATKYMVGSNDNIAYFNPSTRRQIKNIDHYDKVVVYAENTRLGYHGLMLLIKSDDGIKIAYNVFDQEGQLTLSELWVNEPWGDF